MTDQSDSFDDLVNYFKSPAYLRHMATMQRKSEIELRLKSAVEPKVGYVLATSDGRTIEKQTNGCLLLDIGDEPQMWGEEEAQILAIRWNTSDDGILSKVHVVYWREHASAQIERLEERMRSSTF